MSLSSSTTRSLHNMAIHNSPDVANLLSSILTTRLNHVSLLFFIPVYQCFPLHTNYFRSISLGTLYRLQVIPGILLNQLISAAIAYPPFVLFLIFVHLGLYHMVGYISGFETPPTHPNTPIGTYTQADSCSSRPIRVTTVVYFNFVVDMHACSASSTLLTILQLSLMPCRSCALYPLYLHC